MGGGGGAPQPQYTGQPPIPVSPFAALYRPPTVPDVGKGRGSLLYGARPVPPQEVARGQPVRTVTAPLDLFERLRTGPAQPTSRDWLPER